MDLKKEIAKRGQLAKQYLIDKCEQLINPEHPLRTAALHYPRGGGKGFRPAMLQLVCGALGGDESKAIPVAAAIESVHVSSLIHDDFMDKDEVRRGIPAVWKHWDPTIAILAGDVLFGVAFAIAGEINDLADEIKYVTTRELAEIYIKLCHGQMLDIDFESTNFNDLNVDNIKEMQYLKTGVLFEFACITGARIALNEINNPMIEKIREYAKLSGTAFQIQDDIIGLIGDEDEIGKPVGSDIIEGKRTLIAIHAVQNANDTQKKILLETLGNHDASENDIRLCLSVMQEIGSIDFAKDLASDMAEKAMVITEDLPDNDQTELLELFAKYMIERKI